MYIMAFDCGTTSARTLIYDDKFHVVAKAQKEIRQYFPQPGWVEEDPAEIFSTQLGTATEAMAKVGLTASDITAIGLTNQRETTVVWDKATGEVIYNAIVWQCRRTVETVARLKPYRDMIYNKTGLELDAYFSATKIAWILDHVAGARLRAEAGELAFGTVDTYVIWRLSGEHVTDVSNASRTMLYNIHRMDWDDELLTLMGVPRSMLPEVKDSAGLFGTVATHYFGADIPITAAIGDQQSALFGSGALHRGDAKNTYGTGAFLLMNTGDEVVRSQNGLVSTVAWRLKGEVTYALEGSIFIAGAGVQWLRDEMKLIDSAEDSEYLAAKVSDTAGCVIVPAFTGLGAPYWDGSARGTVCGLTRSVTKAHFVRATLESVAYLSYDVLHAMEEDLGGLTELKVDGGASANNFLMQFQADIIGRPVLRGKDVETTVKGAAYLAAIGAGKMELEDVLHEMVPDRTFMPAMANDVRQEKLALWHKAVGRSGHWAD
ncbi:glycerol kinase GlpK [Peptoniphilus equinus]|uniref:ATP:glycerol 3-phosphotransferase n=1 Tax=Peptoniphilus equinus TaxID=3016343 RepID=A0ABY7QTT1_9FIRM|nr:glycerol kinase GlpK [Peptoniphilus equinus]WBW50184.1 glycerol kinase GlpK [Peptoniphilus equinus]